MNYEESLSYIHQTFWQGSRPGLERIMELLKLIGNPEKELKFVHIAGTNGKGSTSAMIESVLRHAGYKTGLFTSPFIEFFNERMCVDGKPISNDTLAEITSEIAPLAGSMKDRPTEFELITAIGFEYFRREKVDIVVCEVGMGGRLDSTNVIESPEVSVITGIALDHTAFLGDTIAKIAAEKAGIIKKKRPVVFGGDDPDALEVISQKAKEMHSPFKRSISVKLKNASVNGLEMYARPYGNLKIRLAGLYQLKNVGTALRAIEILSKNGWNVPKEAVTAGLADTVWKGRFEKLKSDPDFYFDGGHNIEGVTVAAETASRYFGKVYLIFGVMADKRYEDMVSIIAPSVEKVFCITPDNPRALKSSDLAKVFEKNGVPAAYFDTVKDAIRAAVDSAEGSEYPVLSLGSLYSYKEVKDSLNAL